MKFEIEIDEQEVRKILTEGCDIQNLPKHVARAVVVKATERMARQIVSEHTGRYYETKELLGNIRTKVIELLEPSIKQLAEEQMKKVWSESRLEKTVKNTVDSKVKQIVEDKAQDIVGNLLVVTPEDYKDTNDQ